MRKRCSVGAEGVRVVERVALWVVGCVFFGAARGMLGGGVLIFGGGARRAAAHAGGNGLAARAGIACLGYLAAMKLVCKHASARVWV